MKSKDGAIFFASLEKLVHEMCLIRIKEQVEEKMSTVRVHWNVLSHLISNISHFILRHKTDNICFLSVVLLCLVYSNLS